MNRITALLVSAALLSSANVAAAGTLADAVTEPEVIPVQEDEGSSAFSFGSLGGGGAAVAAVVALAAAAALAGSDSGSH